jgi:hypothetical protein
VKEPLCKISSYLNEEEFRDFNRSVLARGVTQSGYIREMLGFEVKPRGAPKGPRKKKAEQAKPVKSNRAGKEKRSRQSTPKPREQLSFLD